MKYAIPASLALLLAMVTVHSIADMPPMANQMAEHTHQWQSVTQAVCSLQPTAGSTAHGVVRFTQDGAAVHVVADVEGLTPNQQHGFHIHEYGDITSLDAKSAGGHYNPEGFPHGLPQTTERHAGDLGNLQADADGNAHYEVTVDNISVTGMLNPIIGRAVIVHAQPDDGGQPTGNSGARIAAGVIGIAAPTAP